MDILDAVGRTSMVRLQRIVPQGAADVFAKLEWENPTGSMKDRMALNVIRAAESDGRLKPGGGVVEYTGALMVDSGLKHVNTDLYRHS